MPSSGDCEVAVERALLETEAHQFDTEMAAPVIRKDAKWHRSEQLHRECEWKQGDAAGANVGRAGICLPLVGDRQYGSHDPKTFPRRKVN
jgi:hypothetical protein